MHTNRIRILPTFYVPYLLLEVSLERVGAVVLSGVAGPEVENVVAWVAPASAVVEAPVDAAAVVVV